MARFRTATTPLGFPVVMASVPKSLNEMTVAEFDEYVANLAQAAAERPASDP